MSDLEKLPNPGSYEAMEQGCSCPRLDNNHGWGSDLYGKDMFWIDGSCPIHGSKEPTKEEVRKAADSLMTKLQKEYHQGDGQ